MKNTLLAFHIQYKHSGTFAHRKYEELSYTKNQKMCDPILVTLLKVRPRYSHSSHENATPSSATSLSASYEKVLPPPPPRIGCLPFTQYNHPGGNLVYTV